MAGRAHAFAKSGDGPVQSIRLYKVAKDSAVKARTQATNQLKAVLVTACPALRETLAGLNRRSLIRACAALREEEGDRDPIQEATRFILCLLAQRIGQLTVQIREVERRLAQLIGTHFPQLLAAVGIGPDSAAALLVTMGGNVGRLCSEAAFAALCGASPVAYHSGLQRRHHRRNRGGDRRAHAALHRIVLTRLRWDLRTQAYFQRRTEEGRTRREITRCLKR
ncbi:hypothetical protein DEJ48_35930 [Streptomyces venezuelae]|uniref:Transposase IS116/IS110/IS902 C-terminal domain-containing protein n=1 Tax=Streptomyces venezuelae TaxID=54571 RepID=A0A5P2C623_STRVZ|nr:transposase [Streptomyces venezuelae]QES38092.1 hypothetical protein DEJ48_35930 [Streptomyces venezuelae]